MGSNGASWRADGLVEKEEKAGASEGIHYRRKVGVCVPGLGEGEDFGTFPSDWGVRQLTNTPGWVEILKSPEAGERVQEGVHWQRLDKENWMPATVVFCMGTTSTIGLSSDYLDTYDATHLHVLCTRSDRVEVTPAGYILYPEVSQRQFVSEAP